MSLERLGFRFNFGVYEIRAVGLECLGSLGFTVVGLGGGGIMGFECRDCGLGVVEFGHSGRRSCYKGASLNLGVPF